MILEIADGNGLFPERQIKTAAEVAALRKGILSAALGKTGDSMSPALSRQNADAP